MKEVNKKEEEFRCRHYKQADVVMAKCLMTTSPLLSSSGYAVLVEKVGHFLEKVLVVWRKSRAFSENARVRSFSQPEKLPLKIHTGSSGTVYSYWVEKALLFPNWSSFSRQTPSPYVSGFRRFSLNCEGEEVWGQVFTVILYLPTCKNGRSP
jgi:hypothetical protein